MSTATTRLHPNLVRITLPVDGMTCAACQANVQRALTATPGVAKAAVNLMTHEATVHYDPAATDPAQLVAAINDTGYVVAPARRRRRDRAADDDAREQAQAREYAHAAHQVARQPGPRRGRDDRVDAADEQRRAWRAFAAIRCSPGRCACSIRRCGRAAPWLYAIDPHTLPIALLAATVFVMAWAGRHFYVRAWKGLRHRTADMNTLIAIGTGAAFLYSVAATLAPELFVDGRRPARRLLRSGHHHHRAGAARQRDGSARQAQHHARPAPARDAAAVDARGCGATAASSDVPIAEVRVRRPRDRAARRAHSGRRRDRAAAAAPSTNRC